MFSSSVSRFQGLQFNVIWVLVTFLIALTIRIYNVDMISVQDMSDQFSILGLEYRFPCQWFIGLNIVLGSLTSSIIYLIALAIYSRRWYGIVAALVLAFQPWHIYYSLNSRIETILGFLIAVSTLFLLKKRMNLFALISGITALISSITWIILLLESSVLFREHKSRKISLMISPSGIIGVLLIYSQLNENYPSVQLLCIDNIFSLNNLLFYFNSLFLMTFSLFYLGFIFAILKNKSSRLISIIVFLYVIIISIFNSLLGWQDISQLIIIIPLISLMIAAVMPRFNGNNLRKVLVFIALFFIIVIPFLSQISFIYSIL